MPSGAHSIMKYKFINEDISLNSIIHYFEVFNRIVMEYYISKLDSILLDGEVEIDESHLFKEKASYAPHRGYALSAVWLFGICKRGTKDFIIFPVTNRTESNLLKVIFKYIKVGSTIYSDSFSCYVNNSVFPRESKLMKYNYIHHFVNHKEEFVSALFTKIHTNTIEIYGNKSSNKLKKIKWPSFIFLGLQGSSFSKPYQKKLKLR